MIRFNLQKPGQLKGYTLSRADLVRIGAKAIDTIQKRCARGQTVDDRASKPLSPAYKAMKLAMGQPGIRNEMFSGSMLGALAIVEATQDRVVVGFTRQAELVKASKNQQRSPWFGLSKNDEAIVSNFAGRILKNKVTN